MANEIQIPFPTGNVLYSRITTPYSGGIWNGTNFVAYDNLNYTTYAVTMTEVASGAAFYQGDFPTSIVAGVYNILTKQQLGGSPAQTDKTVGVGEINWAASGGPIRALSDLMTSGQLGSLLPTKVTRGNSLNNFQFKLVSSADHVTPFTSGIVSGQICRDNGSFTSLQSGGAVAGYTEIGLGWYRCSLTSGDLLCNTAALNFTATGVSGGTSDPRDIGIVTQRG